MALWLTSVALLVLSVTFLPWIRTLHFAPFDRTSRPAYDRQEAASVDLEARPTMETMLSRYEEFEQDLITELDARLGRRTWRKGDGYELARSGCGEDEDPSGVGESVTLPAMETDDAYPSVDWDRVREVAVAVGRKHGFVDTAVLRDMPGFMNFVGRDEFAGVYDFIMGRGATFYVTTGCHRWEHPPAPQ